MPIYSLWRKHVTVPIPGRNCVSSESSMKPEIMISNGTPHAYSTDTRNRFRSEYVREPDLEENKLHNLNKKENKKIYEISMNFYHKFKIA